MDNTSIRNQQTEEAKTAVGGYLLTWGQLESRLASDFHNIAPHRRGPHIDPKDISKTLAHLARQWAKEVKKNVPASSREADDLVEEIISAAGHRNTICHGWQGVITGEDIVEWNIVCWHKFNEVRSTGQFPAQRLFGRSFLEKLTDETKAFRLRVKSLTESAQIEREKVRVPEESIFRQTPARPE
jgi:hypothetical protein